MRIEHVSVIHTVFDKMYTFCIYLCILFHVPPNTASSSDGPAAVQHLSSLRGCRPLLSARIKQRISLQPLQFSRSFRAMSGQLVWGTSNHNFTVHRQSRYSDKKVDTCRPLSAQHCLCLSRLGSSSVTARGLPRPRPRPGRPPAAEPPPPARTSPAPGQVLDNTFNICTERSQEEEVKMSSVNIETVRWPGGTLGTDRARGWRGTRVGPRPPRPHLARARAASTGCGPSEPCGASARHQTGHTKFCIQAHLLDKTLFQEHPLIFSFFLSHSIAIVPPTSIVHSKTNV